jgi:hypothetical protein
MIRLKTLLAEMSVKIDARFNADVIDTINDEYRENYDTLTPLEINDGYCDIWASQFTDRFGGEHQWSFDFPGDPNGHSWVTLKGRFYDAEIPGGVTQLEDIPYFQRAIKRIGNNRWIDSTFKRNIQTSGERPCND